MRTYGCGNLYLCVRFIYLFFSAIKDSQAKQVNIRFRWANINGLRHGLDFKNSNVVPPVMRKSLSFLCNVLQIWRTYSRAKKSEPRRNVQDYRRLTGRNKLFRGQNLH